MQNVQVFQEVANVYGHNLETDGIFGRKSAEAKTLLEAKLAIDVFKPQTGLMNYTGFLAVRSKQIFDNLTTDFLLYLENSKIVEVLPCGTRAGNFWVYNPITYGGITGTAVLAEGYYPKTWLASIQTRFRFRSVEFLQVKPVKIWRDGNRNKAIDKSTSQTGMFGINIHTAGWDNIVDRWSAGCLVVPKTYWDAFTAKHVKIGEHYSLILVEIAA